MRGEITPDFGNFPPPPPYPRRNRSKGPTRTKCDPWVFSASASNPGHPRGGPANCPEKGRFRRARGRPRSWGGGRLLASFPVLPGSPCCLRGGLLPIFSPFPSKSNPRKRASRNDVRPPRCSSMPALLGGPAARVPGGEPRSGLFFAWWAKEKNGSPSPRWAGARSAGILGRSVHYGFHRPIDGWVFTEDRTPSPLAERRGAPSFSRSLGVPLPSTAAMGGP